MLHQVEGLIINMRCWTLIVACVGSLKEVTLEVFNAIDKSELTSIDGGAQAVTGRSWVIQRDIIGKFIL